jgi:4-amino-4-deoxy-L-arabinose transferase-like glycosyltransferase
LTSFSKPKKFLINQPWILFALFTFSTSFLAYFHLPLTWELELFFLGLVVPWVAALWTNAGNGSKGKPLFLEETYPRPPFIFLSLLFLLTAFLRFYRLTDLSLWPLTDEAKSGYFSMKLAEGGAFQLLYDFSQLPPLYIWLQGLFFKLFGVSLSSLWCLPALLSLLTVPAAYFAARNYFSKSFSLLVTTLMAFSFWPLYVGRFSHPGGLLLLWECLTFWVAGLWMRRTKPEGQKKWAFLLGVWVGVGFYTFTSWPTMAFVLTLWVLVVSLTPPGARKNPSFFPYLGGMLLVCSPLGLAWLQQTYGGYIQYVWMFRPQDPWLPQVLSAFSDLSAFFFKTVIPENLFAYKPFWGGYLNSLLGSAFFLGTLELFRLRSLPLTRFLCLALGVLAIPGVLTGGVEMFRVVPLLPILLVVVGLGITRLWISLKPSFRKPVFAVFFLISMACDSYQLFGVYHSLWTQPKDNWFGSKSVERLRAFSILDGLRREKGPGYVMSDLVPDLYDQSLTLATYSFNPGENPRLRPRNPQWAAFLVNIHYQPYLTQKFPESKWVWLAPDLGSADGGLALGLVPFPSSQSLLLTRYLQANGSMQELVHQVFDNRDYKPREPVIQSLVHLYSFFKGEPFLESCFWEKIAENEYGDRQYEAQIAALERAITRGLPTAPLYNELGALYLRRNHYPQARRAFSKALRCKFNRTSAAEGLKLLDETEKTGEKPRD